MSNIKIFLSYHKNYHMFKTSVLTPIHVGAVLSDNSLNILRDDSGDNISNRNQTFCELTAQYWAWKNVNSEYIGFMHYRRLFNFSTDIFPEDKWGTIVEHNVNELSNKYKINDQAIEKCIGDYDILVAKKWDVKHAGSENNYMHYKCSDSKLHIEDYNKAIEILLTKYPEYKSAVEEYHKSNYGYFTNMFIMRKNVFHEYSNLLFNVLFELEKQLDISKYDVQEKRVFGYISEWILGIFITYITAQNRLKIKELQRVFLDSKQKVLASNAMHLFFAADNKFARHLGVAITSILVNSKDKDNLCFYIMDGGISNRNKYKLEKLTNHKIEFIKINDKLFEKLPLTEDMIHTSRRTYYRYLVPVLKPYLSKVLYLDCDLIVKSDLHDLWSNDITDYYAAACEDTWKYPALEWKLELGLNPRNFYFNAGVMLLNLDKMRQYSITDKLFKVTKDISSFMKYQDQDVLNLVLQDNVKLLPLRWNVQQTAFFDTGATKYTKDDIEKAKSNPGVIHFSGARKPWQSGCLNPLWSEYLYYLKMSLWSSKALHHKVKIGHALRKLKHFLKNI